MKESFSFLPIVDCSCPIQNLRCSEIVCSCERKSWLGLEKDFIKYYRETPLTNVLNVSRSTHAYKIYRALSYALSVCKDPTVLNSMRFVFLYEHTGQARFNTVERKIKQCINYQIIYKRQSICQSYTQSSNQSYNQSFDYNKAFHYHCWGSFQVENHYSCKK